MLSDRHFIGNWRPISLLNTDLKIASAVIANRIKPLLPFIISDTQKGFIKGRFIGENTRLLYDLMHYLEQHNKTGLLFLVDFEKAFDSVEWKFLKKALSSFNFGPSVCKWFELFYSKAKSCVINKLIINGNRGLILLAITVEAILRSIFNKLIGLQLPIKWLSFPSFGMHVMTP
jgi:hypothetical protein